MVQDPSVVPSSDGKVGGSSDVMNAFQLRSSDKCPNETAEYGYSLDTETGVGVHYTCNVNCPSLFQRSLITA